MVVGLIGESGHASGEVVFLAFHFDRTLQAAELDADEVFRRAIDPFGTGERGTGGGAFAVLTVAGSAEDKLLLAGFEKGGVDGGVRKTRGQDGRAR